MLPEEQIAGMLTALRQKETAVRDQPFGRGGTAIHQLQSYGIQAQNIYAQNVVVGTQNVGAAPTAVAETKQVDALLNFPCLTSR